MTKSEIIEKYKNAKTVRCAFDNSDLFDMDIIDWTSLQKQNNHFFVQTVTTTGRGPRLYFYNHHAIEFATIETYRVKPKMYKMKKECEKYFSADRLDISRTLEDWGCIPVTMLDEVKEFEAVSLGITDGEYIYKFKLNGESNIVELSDHLDTAIKSFLKIN